MIEQKFHFIIQLEKFTQLDPYDARRHTMPSFILFFPLFDARRVHSIGGEINNNLYALRCISFDGLSHQSLRFFHSVSRSMLVSTSLR